MKEKLLLADYQHFSESLWRNEEAGERRVSFFITLTTAVISALVALAGSELFGEKGFLPVAALALLILFFLGEMIYFRMLQRNAVTDEYQRILAYIRKKLHEDKSGAGAYRLPFGTPKRKIFRGSLAQIVGLLNSILLSLMLLLTGYALAPGAGAVISWVCTPILFLASLWLHVRAEQNRKQHAGNSGQSFRAGVGAVITNDSGQVLVFNRSQHPGSWQFPQGGLEADETPEQGVKREILEETGIRDEQLIELDRTSAFLVYELPPEFRKSKTGRGQAQKWFLFKFKGPDSAITPGVEFSEWKWYSFKSVVEEVIEFRKPVYEELYRRFSPQIQQTIS